MSHFGPESIAMDTMEGFLEVDEVNKQGCVPINKLLNNFSQSKI